MNIFAKIKIEEKLMKIYSFTVLENSLFSLLEAFKKNLC
jgi:hypothetical protein